MKMGDRKTTHRKEAPNAEFVIDYPAMKIGNRLVVADVHLGITREIYEAGIAVPSQVQAFVKRLNELKAKTRTKQLILLGDVKHKVPGVSWQEQFELPEFLEKLGFEEIVIIKGNHDAEIEHMIPAELRKKVKVRPSLSVGDFLFTHGHRHVNLTSPKGRAIRTIIIGHNQPAVIFRDEIGARYVEPVWVRGALGKEYTGHELIIVPAFNELRGHVLVNRDKLIGPIAKTLSKTAHAFLLDGTDLGTLADLKPLEE